MCYGDSIFKTCRQCSSFDQIFELRGYCSNASRKKTWWILPCAILEEVPVAALCDGCLRCVDWLGELDVGLSDLPTTTSDDIPMFSGASAETSEFGDKDDISMARFSTRSEPLYTWEKHLKAICSHYETLSTSLLPLGKNLSTLSPLCLRTKNASLIAKLGILEAKLQLMLSSALADLEYVIETNTWIRQVTSDVNKLNSTEAEELRQAVFEMRMSYIGLVEDGSAEMIVDKLWDEAYEVCDTLEAVEEEMMKKTEASGRSKVVDETGGQNLMSRVKSLIWC